MDMDLNDQVNAGASSSSKKRKLPSNSGDNTPSLSSSLRHKRKMSSDMAQENYEELKQERRMLHEELRMLHDKILWEDYKQDQIEAVERSLTRVHARLSEITKAILQRILVNSPSEAIRRSDQGSSRSTSSSSSPKSSVSTNDLLDPTFRKAVTDRDTKCIITGDAPSICDATHIVPLEYWTEHLWTLLPEENDLYEVKVQEQLNISITPYNGKKISFDANKRNQWPDKEFLLDHNRRFDQKAGELKAGLLKASAELP
ncbi:hypothetical protein HDU76_009726, partial [Blyttiomyces sp. JEL0837]